jgi:hypothetical protein
MENSPRALFYLSHYYSKISMPGNPGPWETIVRNTYGLEGTEHEKTLRISTALVYIGASSKKDHVIFRCQSLFALDALPNTDDLFYAASESVKLLKAYQPLESDPDIKDMLTAIPGPTAASLQKELGDLSTGISLKWYRKSK